MSLFAEAYSSAELKPRFHMSYGYGVPIFKITHKSEEEHLRSERSGANAAFAVGIQRICGALGSQSNPYQASRAIHFTWGMVGNEAFYPARPSGGASEA